jgi:hypothetical protein
MCTVVKEEEISPELLAENDRETASWKFSFQYHQWFERQKILDCITLSAVRSRPVPAMQTSRIFSFLTPLTRGEILRRFLIPVEPAEKVRFVFDSLLMQRDAGPPPPYSDDCAIEVGPVSGYWTCKDKKG